MIKNQNSKRTISLIAVVAQDRGIGKDNKLLFNIPEDLQHFKSITMGHTVIMGLNTYKSLGCKALPGRRNVVLSPTDPGLNDAEWCGSIEEALEKTAGEEEIFFIGGASIYQQSIKFADKLYLTLVDAAKPADTYFPDYSEFDMVKVTGNGQSGNLKYKYLELTK